MSVFLLTLGYDGTDYCGWQKQKNARSLQETVEDALYALTAQRVAVTASGRTDEGVHACAQAVSFSCDTSIPPQSFAAALNAYLPPSVRAVHCVEAAQGFCARKCAKKKTYVYRMYLSDTPLMHMERYALRLTKAPNESVWQKACRAIAGTHDFVCFRCAGSSAKTTVRTVYACEFTSYPAQGMTPPVYEFRICGNGFLYKMVRLLAGALLRLDEGKLSWDDFAAALDGQEDCVRKVPAPAKGLWLYDVTYDDGEAKQTSANGRAKK